MDKMSLFIKGGIIVDSSNVASYCSIHNTSSEPCQGCINENTRKIEENVLSKLLKWLESNRYGYISGWSFTHSDMEKLRAGKFPWED